MSPVVFSHRQSISTSLSFSDDHGVALSVEVSDDGVSLAVEHFGDIESSLADTMTPIFGLLPMTRNVKGVSLRQREAFISPAQLCTFADALSALAEQVRPFADPPRSARPALVR